MAALDNVWSMYMGLKDRRRQRERDLVADDKYADQLQQQALGNIRADEQLRLNQDSSQRAVEAVNLEQKRYDSKANVRANQLTIQEQTIDQGGQQIAAGVLKAKADRLKVTAPQAQKLVFYAKQNGAQAALNDPTQMPVVENLIAEVLEVNNFLPEGATFDGFEEIAGPSRDGKSTKVFVPMMEDANGQKMDIGQMLGGEGADAFTAEQIIDFVEAAGQANLGVNTSMALGSMAKAPEANAGESLTQQNLGTNSQGAGTQQTSPTLDPAVGPTVDPAVGPTVDPAVRFGNNRADPNANPAVADPVQAPLTNQQRVDELVLEAAAKYSDQASNLDPDIQKQLEDILLDDVMSMTGANINDAQQMIMESRRNGGGPAKEQFSGYTGLSGGQGVGRALGQIADIDLVSDEMKQGFDKNVATPVKGFFSDIADGFSSSAETTPLDPSNISTTNVNANSSLNDKSSAKQEEKIKANPPTVEEQAQVQSNNIASVIQQQKDGKKRPTQAQRDDRALDLAIRTANGETFTAKQKESYMNTGFLEGTKVSNVTIGYNEYEQHIDQYGVVSYKPMGLSGAAITAINKADVKLTETQMKATEEWWKQAAPYALSAAGVPVTDGDKGKANLGAYMNQKDFHLTAQHFMNLHVSSLAPILGFDPRNGPQDRGEERLLTGVMTAYAKAVQASKSGDVNYSNANSFSAFLKAHSAESGAYLINNKLVHIDEQVDIEMDALQAQGIQGNRAEIRAEQITTLKAMQGPV